MRSGAETAVWIGFMGSPPWFGPKPVAFAAPRSGRRVKAASGRKAGAPERPALTRRAAAAGCRAGFGFAVPGTGRGVGAGSAPAVDRSPETPLNQRLRAGRAARDGNPQMNRKELVEAVAGDTGMSRSAAAETVDAVLEAVAASLAAGEPVTVPGFGTFEVRERAARTGRNPQTGETIEIAASRAPAFRAAKALRDRVN